ncbi:PTS glucose transporter subunit IIB [Mycoplasma anserisalpingitidis]|uniref:PTS glucose transporter subunit IIB n=1 Tax=Mycoplasma anserisalpingitidis TaxID=519450 RepID=A0A5B8KBI7_9MOLU|nr:PTS glucose transporter subunit IIB [Mycoplasma anserisalpingitidis]QDY88447.1 PTS glucose transporter subunit IIB [Mycoplasma anserisalpingitidis]
MNFKIKLKIVFLSIITLGFIWIKWSKESKNQGNTIYQSKKSGINVNRLLEYIGKDNIKHISNTSSRLVVEIINPEEIQIENIKKLGKVSGIMLNSKKLSIILNEYTSAVKEELELLRGK